MANHYTYVGGIVYHKILHNAITADVLVANAVAELCAGARSISFVVTGANLTTRTAVVKVYVSNDGTNFYQYNKLITNAANTNSQTTERVASLSVSGNGSTVLFMDPDTLGSITHFKVEVDVTDTGTPAGTFTVTSATQY